MKVLHLVDGFGVGGTELYVLRLTRALRRRGHAVSLLLIGKSGPLARAYASDGIDVIESPVGSFLSPKLWSRVRTIGAHIEAVDPDIVHAHDRYSNVVAALARLQRKGRRRWIASQRWGMPRDAGWRLASRFAFRQCDCVTANGPGTGEVAARLAGSPARIVVTPNFIETDGFTDPAHLTRHRQARARELGLSFAAGTVVLGCVGRLEAVKRVDWMIRTVGALRDRGTPAELVVVGDGSERGTLEALTRSLGLDTHVHFVGSRPRMPFPQAMFDITLLSSASEGVPNALVESFACGVPCVATEVGGVSALVGERCGLVVNARDEAAFVDAVHRLATDVDLRQKLGRQAHELAVGQWHEDVVLPLIEQVYRSGCAAHR